METDFAPFMKVALEEAAESLREGNHGFGAVIVAEGAVVARAHDRERSDRDPTSHAEMNAIRQASAVLAGDLRSCVLVATHEPCPMCATAIVWAGIPRVAYGYSIREAIAQGRRRIPLPCRELFERAGVAVAVHEGVMREECRVLYSDAVRREVRRLRGAGPEDLARLRDELHARRVRWYRDNQPDRMPGDAVTVAYEMLLRKLEISPDEAPIVRRDERTIVFHSRNACPTLEACRLLDLDTRVVCRAVSEEPTDALVRQLDGRLRFSRNYDRIRPYADCCEEVIALAEK